MKDETPSVHTFAPRLTPYGNIEAHSCPDCGEMMEVCANCDGDYHSRLEDRLNCPSKRLNNTP